MELFLEQNGLFFSWGFFSGSGISLFPFILLTKILKILTLGGGFSPLNFGWKWSVILTIFFSFSDC
jgi:hypothetical protein